MVEDLSKSPDSSLMLGEIPISKDIAHEYNASWWIPALLASHVHLQTIRDDSTILFLGPGETCIETLSMRSVLDIAHKKSAIVAVDQREPQLLGRKILSAASAKLKIADYGTERHAILKSTHGFPPVVICRNPPIYVEELNFEHPYFYPDVFNAVVTWAKIAHAHGSQFLLTTDHANTPVDFTQALREAGIQYTAAENRRFLEPPIESMRKVVEVNYVIQQHVARGMWPDRFTITIK